jgi:anhydro-N-acetylmuramic acid kinase
MSGTSLDGIDVAELFLSVREDGKWDYKFGKAETIAYSVIWKERLQKAVAYSTEALSVLNNEYTVYLAEVISTFITKNQIQSLDAVCSHGHTILHQPEKGITLQIGNLSALAKRIKQIVVCDFRVQDVDLGGQGAPLVPIGDFLLFSEYDYCLNLGGFANVSLKKNGKRIAYDICPVNIVLNTYAERLGVPFDEDGKLAKNGNLLLIKSAQLQALPYYKLQAPKSLGLEWVQKEVVPILEATYARPEDSLRTFTDHAAHQIARQFKKGSKVLVTGGGAYNSYLLQQIKKHKKVTLLVPNTDLLEYKEALIFGLLGVLKLRGEVNCLASVTGAARDHSSGLVFK